jgi:hypothetical protein
MNWCHGNCWQELSYKGTQLNSWMPRRHHYCHCVIGQEGHLSSSSFNKSWMLWLKGSKVGTPIKMHSDMKYLQVRVIAGRTTAFYLCIVSLHLCLQEHSGPSHCCVEGGTCPGQCNKPESPKLLTPEYKQFPVKRLHGDLTLTAAWCDHKYAKVALPQMVARAPLTCMDIWFLSLVQRKSWGQFKQFEQDINFHGYQDAQLSAGPGRSILKAQISLIWVISQIFRQDYMWSIAMRSLGERLLGTWVTANSQSYGFITFAYWQ